METLATLPSAAQDLEMQRPTERIELVRTTLKANEAYIASALGRFMSTERFQRLVVTLVRDSKGLLECKPSSVILAAMRIAQLQLSPDPALGQAWIIPRKGLATFSIGYKGYLALAYRSRRVLAVRYSAVHNEDHFAWRDGKSFRLDHAPNEKGWPANQGETKAAWAILDLRGGGQVPRVMYLPEILRHKARGEGKQPAWVSDFAAQAVKTVIGDVCRRGPLEEEFGRALSWDAGEQPEDPEIKDVTPGSAPDLSTKAGAFVAAFGGSQQGAGDPPGDPEQSGQAEASPEDEDPLGDALGAEGETLAGRDSGPEEYEAPHHFQHEQSGPPPHVARIYAAGLARGLDEDETNAHVGANVRTSPPEFEHEALRKLKSMGRSK